MRRDVLRTRIMLLQGGFAGAGGDGCGLYLLGADKFRLLSDEVTWRKLDRCLCGLGCWRIWRLSTSREGSSRMRCVPLM